MQLVCDSSVFLATALKEPERSRIIELTASTDIHAPEVLHYQIGNALSAMVRRKRLKEEEALGAWHVVQEVPVRLHATDVLAALTLALEHGIYAYDAYFLACALKLSSPLLTLDRQMQRVATNLGIPLPETPR